MANRYLVDIKSVTHQKAIEMKLSYIEGIILNDIAYMESRGMSGDDRDWLFLHMPKEDFDEGISSLLKKKLIIQRGSNYFINNDNESLEELFDKDSEFGPLLATMAATFIEKTGLNVGVDPLKGWKEK